MQTPEFSQPKPGDSHAGLEATKASQADIAFHRLKGLILDGTLPAGTQMLELEAADRLGMSRTPVREAMVRLRAEGIVEIRPRHGMRVLPVSPDDMREIYEVLTSLEATAAERVASGGAPPRTLATLKAAVRAMDKALEAGDLMRWAEADQTFHRKLVEACGNTRLIAAVEQLQAQAHRARLLTLWLRPKPVNSNRDHRALVQAIEAGDGRTARRVHRNHREQAGRMLVELLGRFG